MAVNLLSQIFFISGNFFIIYLNTSPLPSYSIFSEKHTNYIYVGFPSASHICHFVLLVFT